MANDNNETYAILSIVFGVIGLIVAGVIFGILAIIFGALGRRSGNRKTLAIIGLILGIIDIVIVIIVMVWITTTLVQMGVFEPSGGTAPGFTGFGAVKPIEWACDASPGRTDTLTVSLINGAGGRITGVSMETDGVHADCNPDNVGAGDRTLCTVSGIECGADFSGNRFEATLIVDYVSPTDIPRTNTGAVWGAAD